jgi:nanoRNase/pAp phosphatase (c-di-AMP/oligoRNAs hydrolase)
MPISDSQFQQVAEVFNRYQTFLLIPHDRPDGDALGSMLALASALEIHGKNFKKAGVNLGEAL